MTDLHTAAREHLQAQYADVFTPQAIERHLQEYVGEELAAELVALVLERQPTTRSILDLGCGYGSFVLGAREKGLDAVGLEVAEFEVDWARRRLAERRPLDDAASVYVRGDAARLPFDDCSFDAVTLWNVLEHVRDAERAVSEAGRVVKRGGSVFVVAPNYAAFRREAHYHVPWLPLLPRPAAVAYLRALGRNADFYRDEVFPISKHAVIRAFGAAGLEIRDPRADKLATPESIGSPLARKALGVVARAHAEPLVRLALRVQTLNPVSSTIFLEGVRR